MRQRWCKFCHGWHDIENWPHNCMPADWSQRSDLPGPMVISDAMDPVQSMLDGKLYDSKSTLRRTYKEGGVVEVGNDSSIVDPKPFRKPKVTKEDVRPAVRRAFSKAGLGA